MKYCTKCGHQMADDMLFCQKCGAKSEPIKTEQTAAPQPTEVKPAAPQQTYTAPTINTQTASGNKKVKIRKGMKVGMIICFVFAAIYGLISIAEPSIFAMTLFFFVLGLMFLSLGLVPKESKYMYLLGKPCKLKKSLFVVISIIVAFVICGISMSINPPEATTDNPASQQQQNNDDDSNPSQQEQDDPSSNESKNDQQSATENKPQKDKTTLSDVEKWYTNQTSAVSQSLMEYAKSIDGLTSLNVDSSKFRFGEDSGWYDCHYTFIFTCKVNGTTYNGEARAFMKYQDNTVNWFHFEIFSNTGVQSLVEHYDDSYDQIIEDYYKELESKYN